MAFSLADKHSNCVAVLRLLLPIMAMAGMILPREGAPSPFIEGELLGGIGRVWRRHTRATSGRSLIAWLRLVVSSSSAAVQEEEE